MIFHIHSKQCPHLVSTRFLAGAQSKALPNDHPKKDKNEAFFYSSKGRRPDLVGKLNTKYIQECTVGRNLNSLFMYLTFVKIELESSRLEIGLDQFVLNLGTYRV